MLGIVIGEGAAMGEVTVKSDQSATNEKSDRWRSCSDGQPRVPHESRILSAHRAISDSMDLTREPAVPEINNHGVLIVPRNMFTRSNTPASALREQQGFIPTLSKGSGLQSLSKLARVLNTRAMAIARHLIYPDIASPASYKVVERHYRRIRRRYHQV